MAARAVLPWPGFWLVTLVAKFALQTVGLIGHVLSASSNEAALGVLPLIGLSLMANLLLMVIFSCPGSASMARAGGSSAVPALHAVTRPPPEASMEFAFLHAVWLGKPAWT